MTKLEAERSVQKLVDQAIELIKEAGELLYVGTYGEQPEGDCEQLAVLGEELADSVVAAADHLRV